MLTEHVPAPPQDVRAFYADLVNMSVVHPLIASVRSLRRTATSDGYVQCYRVTDRIPFGPFALRTVYRVRMVVPASGDVTAEARQFPRVRLHTVVSFTPAESGTQVAERISIQAPPILAPLTARKALAAHREMLAGIRRRFGG
ncbi:SRPBCC family protein [Mycobacterium sp. B14F4]|uniref:SRPBCC family protein n=1 Tax=Mycobacterium sp. B14F4 TaxID=3153565 RepID=UPI00325F3F94